MIDTEKRNDGEVFIGGGLSESCFTCTNGLLNWCDSDEEGKRRVENPVRGV